MKARKPLFEAFPPFNEYKGDDEYIRKGIIKCKFLKETREEARIFHYLHNQPIQYYEVLIALCSDDFCKPNEIEIKLNGITTAINDIYPNGYCKEFKRSKYHDIIVNIALALDPYLKCFKHKTEDLYILYHLPKNREIIFEYLPEKMKSTMENPGYIAMEDLHDLNQEMDQLNSMNEAQPFTLCQGLTQDILSWLKKNKIINSNSYSISKSILEKVNSSVFSGGVEANIQQRVWIAKLLLKEKSYITYSDAREIFFPKKDLKKELETACRKDRMLIHQRSNDKKQYIFEISSLLNWLMSENKLSKELERYFPLLKEKAIKQPILHCPELLTLTQLKDYLRHNSPSSQDIKWHVDHEVYSAYIKTNNSRLTIYSHRPPSKKVSKNRYIKRYKGIERLKLTNEDPFQTFSKLLTDGVIEEGQSTNFIEVDSTADECAIGEYRFINMKGGLQQEMLVFIRNEVKAGLKKLTDNATKLANKNKGKISGKVRKNNSEDKWKNLLPCLLSSLENYTGKMNANAFTTRLIKEKIIDESMRSRIAKRIRSEPNFKALHIQGS